MSWIRSRDRTARRLAVVGDYRFPAGVRHRFFVAHDDLDSTSIALVEDAAHQWFRLAARHPRATLSMPSVVVDDLWREAVRDTGYAEFCEAAFGRPLPYAPEHAADRGLADTFRFACEDETCGPAELPLLFRVDKTLAVKGGRNYLADCGGRTQCHEFPGAICLRHVAGVEKAKRWSRLGSAPPPPPDGGFGGGEMAGGL
ncbi:hypothetical protein ACQPZX_39270 [Actinoplanes sp. CA-142083]|uniref:hypothetical protein n=1 Tax=Actinoplanes sp. CA-142083 TaxID=3239903 RepID=UPI003D92F9AF